MPAQLTRLVPEAVRPDTRQPDTRLRKLDAGSSTRSSGLRGAHAPGAGAHLRGAASDTCVPAPGQGIIAVEIEALMRRPVTW
jgi:porphobilinogen deaminase